MLALQQHLDVAIIVTALNATESELEDVFTADVLEGNGIEVVVLTTAAEVPALKHWIVRRPLVNWKMVVVQEDYVLSTNHAFLDSLAPYLTYSHVLFFQSVAPPTRRQLESARWLTSTYAQSFCVCSAWGEIDHAGEKLTSAAEFLILPMAAWAAAGGMLLAAHNWQTALPVACARLQRLSWRKLNVLKKEASQNHYLSQAAQTPAKGLHHETGGFISGPGAGSNLELVVDWRQQSLARERCLHYLSCFPQWSGAAPSSFTQRYQRITLLQTYNEVRHFPAVLEHLAQHCDGIILLDDGSSDGTFERADHPQLLLKVVKPRTHFDDLLNRNILLDLASFFASDWLLFMDADERFHPSYGRLSDWDHAQADSLGFWVVNLWDSGLMFRYDLKDSSSMSKGGIWFRVRMFRPMGRQQIKLSTSRQLHFSPIPRLGRVLPSDIVVVHHGTLEAEDRKEKFAFYEREDKQREGISHQYDYLLEQNPVIHAVSDIKFVDNQPMM